MTKIFPFLVAVFMMVGAPVDANPVERACNRSDRTGASPQLCACIGSVARVTLTRREMRQAARFFRDPDEAQEVRASNRPNDDAFWDRYEAFGEAAELQCS